MQDFVLPKKMYTCKVNIYCGVLFMVITNQHTITIGDVTCIWCSTHCMDKINHEVHVWGANMDSLVNSRKFTSKKHNALILYSLPFLCKVLKGQNTFYISKWSPMPMSYRTACFKMTFRQSAKFLKHDYYISKTHCNNFLCFQET